MLLRALSLIVCVPAMLAGPPPAQGLVVTTPRPEQALEGEKVKALIEQLGSPDFEERRLAARKLEKLGKSVVPQLEKAVEGSEDPELRWQARRLLRRLQGERSGLQVERRVKDRQKKKRRRVRGQLSEQVRDTLERVREMLQDLEEEHGINLKELEGFDMDWPFEGSRFKVFGPRIWASPGKGQKSSQSTKVQVTPDGVRVEIEDEQDGRKNKKTYEGSDMESLLRAHPELRDRISGWSSRRRGGPWRFDFPKLEGFKFKWPEGFGHFPKGFRFGFPESFRFGFPESFRIEISPGGTLRFEHDGEKVESGAKARAKARRKAESRAGKGARRRLAPLRKRDMEEDIDEEEEHETEESGPRLGIRVHEVSEELGSFLDLPEGVGLMIDEVLDDSLAERLGLEEGDLLTRLNGRWIRDAASVAKALKARKEGRHQVEYYRKGVKKRSRPKKK
ncbi:MAG: HEAT repeat domain-containing protein [Planctomycetota bacterium]